MSALAFLLDQAISETFDGNTLVVLDENCGDEIEQLKRLKGTASIVSNRWDVWHKGVEAGLLSYFNDFAIGELIETHTIDRVVYRISKERPITHHVINQVAHAPRKPKLMLAGKKNEGVKGYFDKAKKTFSSSGQLYKAKDVYWGTLTPATTNACDASLDDKNYRQDRRIVLPSIFPETQDSEIISKPGVYGWNKIDQGSVFLLQTIKQQYTGKPQRVLDLGCGTGLLSHQLLQIILHDNPPKTLIATDNNYAAIDCCKKNLSAFTAQSDIQVIAADCGSEINERFELLVCNPPFHQGFDVDRDLTHKFLQACKRLLAGDGSAYFVVNSFIPIEALSAEHALRCTTLSNNKQFKVVRVSHV